MAKDSQKAGCIADSCSFVVFFLHYGLTDFNLCTDGYITHSGGNDFKLHLSHLALISLLIYLQFEEGPLNVYDFYNSRLEQVQLKL
jgi:hypothetical protein